MATVAIEITFTEEVLGSSPNTKEIYSEFIASKAPDAASVADEVEAVGADEVTEKGTTVFPRNDEGDPVIWDYQLKGFMKDACGALRRVPGTLSSMCKAYKKVIDGTIFVKERSVAFQLPEGGEVGICGDRSGPTPRRGRAWPWRAPRPCPPARRFASLLWS